MIIRIFGYHPDFGRDIFLLTWIYFSVLIISGSLDIECEKIMKDVALGIAVRLDNLQVPDLGNLERCRQGRLVRVLNELLKFWSESRICTWMMKENRGFRGVRPIDMVGSEFSTQDLLSAIAEMRRQHNAERGRQRLHRLLGSPSILELQISKRGDIPVELL